MHQLWHFIQMGPLYNIYKMPQLTDGPIYINNIIKGWAHLYKITQLTDGPICIKSHN